MNTHAQKHNDPILIYLSLCIPIKFHEAIHIWNTYKFYQINKLVTIIKILYGLRCLIQQCSITFPQKRNSISLELLKSCIKVSIFNVRIRGAYYSIEVILVMNNLNGKTTTSYLKFRKMRKLNKNVVIFCLRDTGSLQYRLISIEMGRAATL